MDRWLSVLFGALTMVAAVIGAGKDRDEQEADRCCDAFQRALAERKRRDAAEFAHLPSERPV